MVKLQSSIEKIIVVSVIALVSMTILYFVYSGSYKIENNTVVNYITSVNFGNIYAGKNNAFVYMKNNISIGKNQTFLLNIEYMNGTKIIVPINYALNNEYNLSNGEKLYVFSTNSFYINANQIEFLNISLVIAKSGSVSIKPAHESFSFIKYYPPNAFVSITEYLLNTTSSPINGGVASPSTHYYYAGTKVVLNATPNNGYGFIGWYGYGNGNYTGDNSTQIITINGNITEIARFGLLIPFNFKENFNVPYTVGYTKYVGNHTVMLTSSLEYKYSFPSSYINSTSGVKYYLNSIESTCGYNQNSSTINVSYADYNCTIYANYTGYAPVYIFQKSYNSYGGSGTVSPSSGYYQIGKPLTLSAIPNQNSVLFEWVGSGKGSYTGNNETYTLILQGPINETAIFGIKVPVYILSNINGVNISVGTNVYTANTVANLVLGGTYTLSPKSGLLNWGTKIQFTNYTGTTCKLNSNGTVTINATNCAIQENYLKEYLLLIMEQLGNNPPQNTTKYGNLTPGNYTWEPVGSVVSIGAYSSVPGYSFTSFYGEYGTINYSGADSYPYEMYPDSASATKTCNAQSCSCEETTSGPTFDNLVSCNSCSTSGGVTEPYPIYIFTSKGAQVTMDSPIIEIAKYVVNNNYVNPGCYTVNVNYVYENYTITNSGDWSYYTSTENPNIVHTGVMPTKICINESIENWTSGLGEETVTYFTNSGSTNAYYYYTSSFGDDSGYFYWTWQDSYSGVANQSVKSLTYMPSYFNNVVNNVFNNVESNLSSEYKLNGKIWYAASFNFANVTLYYYSDSELSPSSGSFSYFFNGCNNQANGNEAFGPGFSIT